MTGSNALDSVLEDILNRVGERMQDKDGFMPIYLKKHIIGIFMSAMNYNAQLTLAYLENKQMTGSLIQELINVKDCFKHEYEKKLFIIGLSRMLQCQTLPESVRHCPPPPCPISSGWDGRWSLCQSRCNHLRRDDFNMSFSGCYCR